MSKNKNLEDASPNKKSKPSQPDVFSYFKKLETIRERATLLLKHPTTLTSFNVHLDKLPDVVEDIIKLIKRDYPTPNHIPAHSRWRHFEAKPVNLTTSFKNDHKVIIEKKCMNRVQDLMMNWKTDNYHEKVVGVLDLFVVSVLLDAGAGSEWKYVVDENEEFGIDGNVKSIYNRSEGLGIASLDWFKSGSLSSSPKSKPYQCDSAALKNLTSKSLEKAFQVTAENPLIGVEGRCKLLNQLGVVCEKFPKYFKRDGVSRPGNLMFFLLNHDTTKSAAISPSANKKSGDAAASEVLIETLWEVVMEGFSGIWPASRTKLQDKSLGDVWPSSAFQKIYNEKLNENEKSKFPAEGKNLISFHKLSQWLTYSMMEPLQLAGITFKNTEKMTGLAEYRNGGLFVDMGVITLKDSVTSKFKGVTPKFEVSDQVVVEWRALTIALLDKVGESVRAKLKMTERELPLVKILEAGTWKLGREIASKLRPKTKSPPIDIISDGTVF